MKNTTLFESLKCVAGHHVTCENEIDTQHHNAAIDDENAEQNPVANFGFPLIDIDKAFAN